LNKGVKVYTFPGREPFKGYNVIGDVKEHWNKTVAYLIQILPGRAHESKIKVAAGY
jgi:hypothetical protein